MSSASAHAAPDQLADLKQQLQSCSATAQKLTESLSEADLKQRPANQGWSMAECIQHLTATTQLYLPILAAALPDAPAGDGPYKMDWKGRLLKWVLEPPYRSKVKTMPSLEPKIESVRHVLPDFLASQQQFINAMELWNGRASDKVLITSPFNKRLRYNIYSLFNVVAAHQRHHLWQAQRVKDQIKGK
jgi:DinB superfamily